MINLPTVIVQTDDGTVEKRYPWHMEISSQSWIISLTVIIERLTSVKGEYFYWKHNKQMLPLGWILTQKTYNYISISVFILLLIYYLRKYFIFFCTLLLILLTRVAKVGRQSGEATSYFLEYPVLLKHKKVTRHILNWF